MSNSLSNPLRLYTVGTLLKDAAFRRAICQISTVCSGGSGGGSVQSVNGKPGPIVTLLASDIETSTPGQTIQEALDAFGTPTLQSVTSGPSNNITNNVITVTGGNNFDGNQTGLHILNSSGLGGIIYYINGSLFTNVNFTEDGVIQLNAANGIAFTLSNDPTQSSAIVGRLSGDSGINANDFVTVSQLASGGITNSVISGQPPTPTLLPNVYYTYIGEDNISYDLPPVAGNTGTRIGVISATTEIITLNSNAGGNDIIDSGVASSSIQIPAGQARILYNNSLGWIFLT